MATMLAKLELRQLWLLGCGVLMVLTASLHRYGVRPQLEAYRAAVAARDSLFSDPAPAPAPAQLLSEQSQQVEALRRRMHGEMADIPARELEGVVVGRLQDLSWRHGVELGSVRPGRGEQVEIFEELLFDVEIGGRYEDLYAWLHELRRELGFVVIKEYAMERGQQEGAEPVLRASLKLACYRAVAP